MFLYLKYSLAFHIFASICQDSKVQGAVICIITSLLIVHTHVQAFKTLPCCSHFLLLLVGAHLLHWDFCYSQCWVVSDKSPGQLVLEWGRQIFLLHSFEDPYIIYNKFLSLQGSLIVCTTVPKMLKHLNNLCYVVQAK
jgi:hypothetical protein